MAETSIVYHLPSSYLQITGTKTSRVDLASGERHETVEVDIALGVEADPNDPMVLDLKGSGLADTEFTLALTDDGRLTSASGTSTGRAGTILKGAATLVGVVAGAGLQLGRLPGALMARGLVLEGPADAADRKPDRSSAPSYAAEFPKMAERLAAASDAADKLSAALIEAGAGVAAGSVDTARLYQLTSALDVVRKELSLLRQHKSAWITRTVDEQVSTHTFRVPILAVPKAAEVSSPADHASIGTAMAPMLRDLGMIVTRGDRSPLPPQGIPRSDAKGFTDAIVYRRAHYTDLILWRKEGDRFVEVERTTQLVMSDRSPLSATGLDRSMWGKRHLSVEFSSLGTLATLDTDDSSSASEAVAALGQLPADFTTGMTQAGTTGAQLATLRNQRLTQAIARLELEKKHKELSVLEADAPPKPDLAAEVAELELRVKRLQLEAALGELQKPGEAGS